MEKEGTNLTTEEKKRLQGENLAKLTEGYCHIVFDTGFVSAVRDTAEWLNDKAKIYGIEKHNLKALLKDYLQKFDPE